MTGRHAVFRADASATIGTGHVVRCRTLAAALAARGWSVTLAAREVPDALTREWPGGPAAVLQLPGDDDLDAESSEISARLGAGLSLVVDDHYAHGATWLDGMRSAEPRAMLMAIDDLADRPLPVDVLLNQNLGATPATYAELVPRGAQTLVGPRFALLRPEFATIRSRGRVRDGRVERILIFMSGADHADVTARATRAVASLVRQIDVVVGGSYSYLTGLRSIAAQSPRVTIHVNTTAIAELMDLADLAIGAPSSASWERCALGLPAVLVTLADNQAQVGRLLDEAGAAVALGWHDAVTTASIEVAVRGLCNDPERVAQMSRAAAAITDGLGTGRVADVIEAMVSDIEGKR